MDEHVRAIYDDLFLRYPNLVSVKERLAEVYAALCNCYERAGRVLICGNGGSAADAEHMAAELMKGFLLPRKLEQQDLVRFAEKSGENIGSKLQYGLPVISLVSHTALLTAIANDVGNEMIFAQQVFVHGQSGDVLVGFSTSGNSENVIHAFKVAQTLGMKTIIFTGAYGGKLKKLADYAIEIPEQSVYKIQDYHLPIYHVLCAMLEKKFFAGKG